MVQSTAIVSLWAPVVVFAHVFAFGFFMKLFFLSSSRRFSLRRRLSNEKLPKARNSEDDECKEGNEEIVLTLDKATQRQVVSHSGANIIKEKTIGMFSLRTHVSHSCGKPMLCSHPPTVLLLLLQCNATQSPWAMLTRPSQHTQSAWSLRWSVCTWSGRHCAALTTARMAKSWSCRTCGVLLLQERCRCECPAQQLHADSSYGL